MELMYWPSKLALFSLCDSIIGLMDWNDPKRNKPEPESVVAVISGRGEYTSEELEKLLWFTEEMNKSYFEYESSTVGANILRVTKDTSWGGTIWWARKLTWERSARFDSLDDLIESFKREDERYTL